QRLGGLEVDHQLELRRSLDRNIGWLGTFQNLVHIRGGAPAQVGNVRAVKHKPPGFYKIVLVVHDGEPLLYRKFYNLCSLRTEDGAVEREDSLSPPLTRGSKCSLHILGM